MAADACPWCGAALPGGAPAAPWHVVRCTACGVGVTRPWPTDAELDAAYPEAYRPAEGRFSGPGDAVLRFSRGRLARRIDALAPPGPVLDVGSGDGSLLQAVRRSGRAAAGLERGAGGQDGVRALELTELPAGERYAAIVLWHSLEHLRDPAGAVAAATAHLLPGGVLLIAVPNLASLQARAFGPAWLALDLPRHLTHLTAGALRGRLSALGLQVERESHWRGGQVMFGWLHGLVRLLPGRPDLYDALRREQARLGPAGPPRSRAILAGMLLAPVAALAAVLEALLHRGGTVYLEARLPETAPHTPPR